MSNLEKQLSVLRAEVDAALEAALAPSAQRNRDGEGLLPGSVPPRLRESMWYSLSAGGKRLRGALVLAASDLLEVPREQALPYACAIECIHTYSLIHDDLPAMDDDDMRRGRPSNHKVYGEGMAILAGDGLQSFAFEWMLHQSMKWPGREGSHLWAMHEIALRSGISGMIAGQTMDILMEAEMPDAKTVTFIHQEKTAAMFVGALCAGLALGSPTEEWMQAMAEYGWNIGVLFQIVDDMLDITGSSEKLGKATGMDAQRKKQTYPAVYGLEASREKAKEHMEKALKAAEIFGASGWFLQELAQWLLQRDN